jgi:hypothetical protein
LIISDISKISKWSKFPIEVKCDKCGVVKEIKYKLYTSYGYSNGDWLCRSCKLKTNNLEKWGVENTFQLKDIKEKIKKTNLEKWGVENPSQNPEINKKIKESISKLDKKEINKKRIKTVNSKYGVDNISKLKSVKDKKVKNSYKKWGIDLPIKSEKIKNAIKIKNLSNWGTEHIFSSDLMKDKIRNTNLKKWGFENPSQNKEVINKIRNSLIKTLHDKMKSNENFLKIDHVNNTLEKNCECCKSDYKISYSLFYKRRETKTEICTKCNPIDKHQSGKEIKLYNLIKSLYNGEIIQNFKINKQEIDIYLPSLNLGFELNGIWWHCDKFKNKNFHKEKSEFFSEEGIRVIHIWEDDFDNKFFIIKSQIINLIGLSSKIWARKCKVKEVTDTNLIRLFLDENHIQGYVNSNLKLGLYYNDELVSLMTFDHLEGRKRMLENEWNLNRFCNKLEHSVIGGASKLLRYFIDNYSVKRVISYADRDWSSGGLYQKLGFNKVSESRPDYKYLVGDKRVHKSNFKKSITGLSESNLDIHKVWDCGKIKFELSLSQ